MTIDSDTIINLFVLWGLIEEDFIPKKKGGESPAGEKYPSGITLPREPLPVEPGPEERDGQAPDGSPIIIIPGLNGDSETPEPIKDIPNPIIEIIKTIDIVPNVIITETEVIAQEGQERALTSSDVSEATTMSSIEAEGVSDGVAPTGSGGVSIVSGDETISITQEQLEIITNITTTPVIEDPNPQPAPVTTVVVRPTRVSTTSAITPTTKSITLSDVYG